MARGGNQPGSGRKRHLKAHEIVYCWEQCERFFAEARSQREADYWAQFDQSELRKLRELQAKLNRLDKRALVGAILAANADDEEALDAALHRAAERGDDAAKILIEIRTEADDIGSQARQLTKGQSGSWSHRAHKIPHPKKRPKKSIKNELTRIAGDAPNGRQEIFDQVSCKASEEFGRRITESDVKENWKRRRAGPKA